MDKKLVFSWLQDLFNQTDTTFIFHNAMYDICWLRSAGLKIKGKIVDKMIAASLIDENRLSYRLDILAKHYTGVGKDEKILYAAAKEYGLDPKKDRWRLPALFVGQYAELDAESTLKLWQRLENELYAQELWDVFNLETKLFPCLIDMRFKGVRVNLTRADQIKKDLIEREKKLIKRIKFDLKKAEERAHILIGIAVAVENIDEIIKIIKLKKWIPFFAKLKNLKLEQVCIFLAIGRMTLMK